MSGEQKSHSVKEQLAKFEQILEEYTSRQGLGVLSYNQEVEKALNLTSLELAAMSAESCGEQSFVLFQYALYIQKEHNRQTMRVNWAKNNLKIIVAKECKQYGDRYTGFNEKEGLIIANNERAYSLNNIVLHAQARADELFFLSRKVQFMGDSLIELQKTKRRSNG